MIKDRYIKEYSISAFKFYSYYGSLDGYKKSLYNEWTKNNLGLDDVYFNSYYSSKKAEIYDIESVDNTIQELALMGRNDIIKALDIVYLSSPVSKNDTVSMRVTRASLNLYVSESSIYNYISKAIEIFAIKRGLRFCYSENI